MRADGGSGRWEGDVHFSLDANGRFVQVRYKFVDDETSKHADVHFFFHAPSPCLSSAVKQAALQFGRSLH